VPPINSYPQRNTIRLQLRQSQVLKNLPPSAWAELEPQLEIADFGKGDLLVHQGHGAMEHIFSSSTASSSAWSATPKARR
jgi:CRP/FNR family transcriptional regulator, dissimilatory nitrate respiration regulator